MERDDHGHIAMPKLVGAPKYSRPPVPASARVERPPDPDDLPLVNERTPEEHALAQELGLELPALSGAVTLANAGAAPDAAHVPHANGTLTVGGGTIGTESRPRHRGFGLFRRRNDRSGVG